MVIRSSYVSSDSSSFPLTFTSRALGKIASILQDEPPEAALRLTVEGGGCSGFQYHFDITYENSPQDLCYTKGEARFVLDPISLQFVEGSEVDFVEDLIEQAFKIKNPNAVSSCGCGTSFAV